MGIASPKERFYYIAKGNKLLPPKLLSVMVFMIAVQAQAKKQNTQLQLLHSTAVHRVKPNMAFGVFSCIALALNLITLSINLPANYINFTGPSFYMKKQVASPQR